MNVFNQKGHFYRSYSCKTVTLTFEKLDTIDYVSDVIVHANLEMNWHTGGVIVHG